MISGQVLKAIKWAHQQKETQKPTNIKTRDVGGIAATLRVSAGQSVDDVLEAAFGLPQSPTSNITTKNYNERLSLNLKGVAISHVQEQ